jgi:hypothetical protein
MPTFGSTAQSGDFLGASGNPIPMPSGPAMPQPPRASNTNGGPLQTPGNNLVNPGYSEQGLEYTQNLLLEDPYAAELKKRSDRTNHSTTGEQTLVNSLGTLDGPGEGAQYWNQQQGQFNDPYAGEQFTREATQDFAAAGPASAFYDKSQGQYDEFTGYEGPQNAQGQYNASAASMAGGTQGEQGLGQIADNYDTMGDYTGQNQAQGQYQANAASGPLGAQSFYDSVSGDMGTKGTYSDPNRAAAQYEQTQGAFGDMPIANFDPFYDRARQLGVQAYDRGAAGRGVYGSSEALSGVGNVITDIEAQRANRSFDAEMQRAQEQRARQQLLGEQARMGDISGVAAFDANLSGLKTFGDLATSAGAQTLGQQTMLGDQARDADVSATDAFSADLAGAKTFADINQQQGDLEIDRNRVLGDQASAADSQALGAQNANIAGLNAFGDIAESADRAETDRYEASTAAMDRADQTGMDRTRLGADMAFKTDESERADFTANANAARDAGNMALDRTKTGADIVDRASDNDLDRLKEFGNQTGQAEDDRRARQVETITAQANMSRDMANLVNSAYGQFLAGDQADFENHFATAIAPKLQQAGMDQQQIDALRKDLAALSD